MKTSVVVTYTIKPERKEEHIKLIEAVFEELKSNKISNVDYQVLCLEDGVSFIHISACDTPEGISPIPSLEAFKKFSSQLSDRVSSPPKPSDATEVATYRTLT